MARRGSGRVWGLLLALWVGALVWNGWFREVAYRQRRVTSAGAILAAGLVLLLAWVLLGSGLRRGLRLALLGGVAGLLALAALLVEVRGVTGDLVPILGWRLAEEPPRALPGVPAGAARTGVPAAEPPAWRDSPRFLGAAAEAAVAGVVLERDWERHPPVELWRRAVGPGWSGFAVVGHRALTQEQRGGREAVVCYGTLDGEVRWVHEVEARYASEIAGVGPRATPTVAGERVLALGATGVLSCLELATGAELWRADTLAASGGEVLEWGISASPLVFEGVHEGRVLVPAGRGGAGALLAFDLATGERLWLAGEDGPSYASPALQVLGGQPQVVVLNASSVAAHDPRDGRVLWSAPWDHPNPSVSQPLVLPGDLVLVSSGYGAGCALFRVERDGDGAFAATLAWRSLALKSKLSTLAHRDGFVYGFDDGILTCIDAQDGRRRWKDGRYGHGQLLLVGDVLLVTTEDGDLVLVEASPEGRRELARVPVLGRKTWNVPALAAPLLLVRNDEEAVCLRLPVEIEKE